MYKYAPPILAVDAVILTLGDSRLSVLLHQRPQEPFKGMWALPGAYCSQEQSITEALRDRVQNKIGIHFSRLPYFEQLYTFDTKGRDPRGPTVSVAYLGITRPDDYGTSKEQSATSQFFSIESLPQLAFDHSVIIASAVSRLRSKLLYTDLIKYALPRYFTLTQLQDAYELVLYAQFDKRNFRKRFLGLDVITPSTHKLTGNAHRPAQLYEFIHNQPQEFEKNFG